MIVKVAGETGFTYNKEYPAIHIADHQGKSTVVIAESYIIKDDSGVSRRIPGASVTQIPKQDLTEKRDDSLIAAQKKSEILASLGRTEDDYKETKNGKPKVL